MLRERGIKQIPCADTSAFDLHNHRALRTALSLDVWATLPRYHAPGEAGRAGATVSFAAAIWFLRMSQTGRQQVLTGRL
jgi:hypothetical protein